MQKRVAAIKAITDVFKVERFVCLFFCSVSFLVIVASAVVALFKGELETANTILLTGSSGGLIGSVGLMQRMWTKSMELVSRDWHEAGEPDDG